MPKKKRPAYGIVFSGRIQGKLLSQAEEAMKVRKLKKSDLVRVALEAFVGLEAA